jgi:flagellar biosynthesis protein FlhB
MRKTSGGMGKKDDSATAIKNRAQTPEGDCTQSRDLSYICRIQLIFFVSVSFALVLVSDIFKF